jgi:hypothetical protein
LTEEPDLAERLNETKDMLIEKSKDWYHKIKGKFNK